MTKKSISGEIHRRFFNATVDSSGWFSVPGNGSGRAWSPAMLSNRGGAFIQHLLRNLLIKMVREDVREAAKGSLRPVPEEAIVQFIAGCLQASLNDFSIENRLQSIVMQSQVRFLVFPEGAVRHWTEATDAFWSPALDGTPRTVLVGAGQPIPGSLRYYNPVVILGKEPREAVHQRIPVPGGMWNPLRPKGTFAADLFAPGTVDVGGQRAAILICYEQLLAWPMLRLAIEHPPC